MTSNCEGRIEHMNIHTVERSPQAFACKSFLGSFCGLVQCSTSSRWILRTKSAAAQLLVALGLSYILYILGFTSNRVNFSSLGTFAFPHMAASLGLVLSTCFVTTYNGNKGLGKVSRVQRITPVGGCSIRAAIGPGRQGGGVLDRPIIEKGTPGRESEFDLKKSRKLSPPYRVMLHNDSYNKREYVVQVLMKVIPGMSVDNAVNIMNEAHMNGLAVVIICGQDDAEEHCLQLRNNGLLSSIEPASGSC